MIKGLDNQVKEIKNEIFRLCWYMRGSVTIDEGFALTYDDRVIISDIIKDNLETTKKTQMPFF
jgi:hypothetical protein